MAVGWKDSRRTRLDTGSLVGLSLEHEGETMRILGGVRKGQVQEI